MAMSGLNRCNRSSKRNKRCLLKRSRSERMRNCPEIWLRCASAVRTNPRSFRLVASRQTELSSAIKDEFETTVHFHSRQEALRLALALAQRDLSEVRRQIAATDADRRLSGLAQTMTVPRSEERRVGK